MEKKPKEKKKNELAVTGTPGVPSKLIELALNKNADLDQLGKVLAFKERWDANEAKKAYHKAMANFKVEAPETILKNAKVDYSPKSGGRVQYNHATLAAIVKAITQCLSKHGLSTSFPMKQGEGSLTVSCKITHELGHSEEFSLTGPLDTSGSKNSIQSIGSTQSYLERYTLLAATGLATEDMDDDGKTAEIKYIDDKQMNLLLDMIADKDVDVGKFCNAFKIDEISKLPKSKYQQAFVALQNRKK